MEAQSQEHLNWAGEITSLRKRWGCWGKWIALGFIEVTVLFDLRQFLDLPWVLVSPSVKWDPFAWSCPAHWAVEVIPPKHYIKGVPKKKEMTACSSEVRMPEKPSWLHKCLTQRTKGSSSRNSDPASPTRRSEVQPPATKALNGKGSSKYGF